MTIATARKIIALLLCTTLVFGGLYARTLLGGEDQKKDEPDAAPAPVVQPAGNFSDEMKIPAAVIIDEGTKNRERMADHPNSPYFCDIDFYNAKSAGSLVLLEKFRTLQQTSDDTCGAACATMVLDYYEKLGDWNEESLYNACPDHSDYHTSGLCLEQMMALFEMVGGFELDTTYDYLDDRLYYIDEDLFKEYIEEGVPVLVAWNDWGGHWAVIIGYDDMGTPNPWDDVLILADPSDNTDHNQDGYTVYHAKRLIFGSYLYGMAGMEDHQIERCFIAARVAG